MSQRLNIVIRRRVNSGSPRLGLTAAHALDPNSVPLVGERGWVLVSGDRRMRTKPAEASALKAAGVTALFLGPFWRKIGIKEQAAWLLGHWNKIDAQLKELSSGSSAKIQ